jgi:hypothetical protein
MKQTTPAQKGLLTGALMIAASLFSLYVLKNPVESYFQYIIYSIFCFGIVFSMVVYYRTATDKKSFTNFFSTGFKTFVAVSLLMAAFAFVYFSFNTEFRDKQIAENSRLLILQGNHLPQEIKDQEALQKKVFLTMMISISIFRYLILGALITVIAAGFLSKKNSGAG